MSIVQKLIEKNVKEHGLAIQFIFPTKEQPGPKFAYTVGMTDIGQPELVVIGLPESLAGMVFNRVFEELRAGTRTGQETSIEKVLSVPLLMHTADESLAYPYTVQCQRYYQERGIKPAFKQLIWPDTAGVYPHEQGFDEEMVDLQPYLCNQSSTAE